MGTVHLHARPRVGALRAEPLDAAGPTLAELADEVDARRYEPPAAVEALLRRALDTDGTTRIVGLSGASGSGKSAALRHLGRRARAAGWRVSTHDGRVDDLDAVLHALDGLRGAPPTVLLLDEADQLGAGLAAVGAALTTLPAHGRVAVAGRALRPTWLPTALEPIAVTHRTRPLSTAAGHELLRRHGVGSRQLREGVVRWAAGLPLALVVGAATVQAAGDGVDGAAVAALLGREGSEGLLARLGGDALDDLDPDLVDLLALAPGVDRVLVQALHPQRADAMLAALQECPLVESAGVRRLLHPALATARAERLWQEAPARTAATVLRVARHEHDRAVAGEAGALTRLAALVRDPDLRAAMGPTAQSAYYADRWRDGDDVRVAAGLDAVHPGVARVLRPWLGAAHEPAHDPAHDAVAVVRRADGRPVALVATLPVAAADAVAGPARRLVAPVVEHARAAGLTDRAVLTAFQLTFADATEREVAWVRNAAGLARSGLANPRIDLVNLVGPAPAEEAALAAWGYVEIATLAREVDDVPVTTWCADAGTGGLAGVLHEAVRAGCPTPAGADGVLLAALEAFHSDAALAALPPGPGVPGPGGGPAERADRAEQVRGWVRQQVAEHLAAEPALLDLVTRRYLEPGATHAGVLRATYLSRATYFRRLRRARELLGAPAGLAPR